MGMTDRIVGELMQPGGIRALERMGLARAAKAAAVDAVPVIGYVCVTPGGSSGGECSEGRGGGAGRDVVLTYPPADPAGLREQLGWLGGLFSSAAPASAGARGGGDAADNVCPVTGADLAPRGRSFHNHRFVHELRKEALAEPNVTVRFLALRLLARLPQLANCTTSPCQPTHPFASSRRYMWAACGGWCTRARRAGRARRTARCARACGRRRRLRAMGWMARACRRRTTLALRATRPTPWPLQRRCRTTTTRRSWAWHGTTRPAST
jgi:hypothetical protein